MVDFIPLLVGWFCFCFLVGFVITSLKQLRAAPATPVVFFFFGGGEKSHTYQNETGLPGKPVAVNFHQLYP